MSDKIEIKAEAAAEKAYAAAAEAVVAKPSPAPEALAEPLVAPLVAVAEPLVAEPVTAAEPVVEVEFPSKAKRARKDKVEAALPAAAPAPVAVPAAKPAPAASKAAAKKPAPKKILPVKAAIAPKTVPAQAAPKLKTPKAAAPKAAASKTVLQQLKETTVSTTDFTTKIKTAVSEAQAKAKEAFDKGAATFADYNEFSKGNVEAVVASGKILAAGVQSLGKTFVEDGKSAIEVLTAEVKELAAVKSPTDFFKLQAEFLRRNLDIVVSNTSKNGEAVRKLASEAAAPISARVSLAVEKVKKAA